MFMFRFFQSLTKKKSNLDNILEEKNIVIFGEDHNNKYARVELLEFLKNNPDIAKNMTLYAEGINDGILTKSKFDIETQYFDRAEKEFFSKCLTLGVEVKGLESKRTSPFKECKTKDEVFEIAKKILPQEAWEQHLAPYVGSSYPPLDEFQMLAQKYVSGQTKRKDFDEDSPKIIAANRESRKYEAVICGYEHVASFKTITRKPVITIGIGNDGTEYKLDKIITHDDKATLSRYITPH